MKNLFLIDMNYEVIHSLVDSELINIHTMVVGSEIYKKDIKSKYNIKNILVVENIQEFYKCQDYELDYKLLLQYKHTQVKIENWFQRFSSDTNVIQYLYAISLSFWHNYFLNNHEIDMVLSCTQEWGSNFDSLILDVATKNNKKVFIIENTLVDGNNIKSQSIFNYVKKEYIKFNDNDNDIDLSKFLHYTQTDKIFHGKSSIKEVLKQIPDKYGGYLLVMFFALLIGKFKSNMFSFNMSWWAYFKNYLHIKNMLRYYQSKSINFDATRKYIFFALHMEPEATTLARTTFSNQLIIIKAISRLLPKEWKLYVKDHPRQYIAFNNFKRYYFLAAINKYRTKMFYDEILDMSNVELINLDTNSKELIEKSEAVVTINGSIILESIVQNKPLLLFAQNSTPFYKFKGVIDIKNSDDLKNAMYKLSQEFNPSYQGLDEFISEYTYNVYSDKEYDYKLVIEKLIQC